MEQGHWFLSLYNDDGDPQELSFTAGIAEDMTQNCPNGCSGKGECLLGHCQCNPGFGGEDCADSEYTKSGKPVFFRRVCSENFLNVCFPPTLRCLPDFM